MKRNIFIKQHRLSLSGGGQFALKLLLCLSPAALALFINAVLRCSSHASVERVYSAGIYRHITSFLGVIGRITPFSLASLILLVLGILVPVLIIGFSYLMIFKNGGSALLKRFIQLITLILSVIFLLFTLLCAPNYYRVPFAEQAGLYLESYTVDDLEGLCRKLISETNEQRSQIKGVPKIDYDSLAADSKAAFDTLSEHYPFVGKAKSKPKPVIFSEALSILNLTGFYFPYTGEANVNVHMPFVELPFTMCHELSHTRGFMLENEANFMGYLACKNSDNAVLRYSGFYVAMVHSMNMMAQTDIERYFKLRELYSPEVSADAAMLSEYWNKYFDTPAAKISDKVNDAYLKANDLSDGIKSYGRMVDLLMAEYLSENSDIKAE